MKKKIGIIVLMGLVVVNTFYSTTFTKELKINSNNKSMATFQKASPEPW